MKKDLIEVSNMNDLKKKDSLTLQQEAVLLSRSSQSSIVELGKRLLVLKNQCLKRNEYKKFIQEKLNMDYNIAAKYVRVVERYGISENNYNVELVTRLGIKKAVKLLVITDLQERIEFIKSHNLIEKTYKEIENILNELYPPKVKELNGYSLYTNIHRSLQDNIKIMEDNKNIFKADKQLQAEAKAINKQLSDVMNRIANFKSKLGKMEDDKLNKQAK